MPSDLERLLEKLAEAVSDLTARLERGEITVKEWQREMEKLLARHHEAAYMLGQDSSDLDAEALSILATAIGAQLEYLDAFAATIAETMAAAGATAALWMPVWNARAKMYAQSPKTTYWKGLAKALDMSLPGYPGESECLSNCGCSWDIQEVAGGYDAYWRRGKTDSCNGCRLREQKWSPFKIRVERAKRGDA